MPVSPATLPARIFVHREALIPGFSSRYKTYRLVYFEQHDDPLEAIRREKQIKKWLRAWKIPRKRESPF